MAINVQDLQRQFVSRLAASTGLRPDVLSHQATLEGAYAPNGTGGYNFMNLRARGGQGYSGVPLAGTSPGGFAQFRNLDDAVRETAHWLNQMPNYAGIRATRGGTYGEQWNAIRQSPWDVGHYGGGDSGTPSTYGGGDQAAAQPPPVGQPSALPPLNIPGSPAVPAMKVPTLALPRLQITDTPDFGASLFNLKGKSFTNALVNQAIREEGGGSGVSPVKMTTLTIPGVAGVPGSKVARTPATTPEAQASRPVKTATTAQGMPVEIEGRASKNAIAAVHLAERYMGTPYSWGGGGPSGPTYGIEQGANTKGFDCSGLIQFVCAKQGVSVGGDTYSQWDQGKRVGRGSLRPGDALFFHPGPNGPEHVGMYVGGNKFIEAPHTGATVRISNLVGRSDYMGARRYL